jgi:hypothetical protein
MIGQALRELPSRTRMLGEKALQQVEEALQGGQQGTKAGRAKVAAPVPQRSQAEADLAMQMLLVNSAVAADEHISDLLTASPCQMPGKAQTVG